MNELKGLGAVSNIPDNRDIALSSVARETVHSKKNITDISMLAVEDQKEKGTCVGQAEGKGEEYREYRETGSVVALSKRFIYGRCKAKDGLKEQGTYPRVAGNNLIAEGAARCEMVPDNNDLPYDQYLTFPVTPEILEDASTKRVKGYAFVYTLDEIKTAIDIEGVMNATIQIGEWSKLPVKPTFSNGSNRGKHRVLLFGYEDAKNGKVADTKIYFRNSWGINWAKGSTAADKKLQKEGNGWFWWSEFATVIEDMMVYTDMPDEALKLAQATAYIFTRTLKEEDRGTDVTELQKRLYKVLAKDGKPCFRYPNEKNPTFSAYYGVNTTEAVKRYQVAHGIVSSGTPETTGYGAVGPQTLKDLNGGYSTLGLYPKVLALQEQLCAIMQAVGTPIVVTAGYRTIEAQNALYAQGRTSPGAIVTNAKGGESFHNWRCAFDIAFKKGAGISYDGNWELVSNVGKILGLEWGGDWATFQDKPHFQYTAGYDLEAFQQNRIDESRFGAEITKAVEPITPNTSMKRVKSFFIVLGSLALSAFIVVLPTVEFANFIGWLQQVVVGWGVPGVVWAVIAAFISQLWFAWRNKVNASKEGFSSVAGASRSGDVDTY